MNTNEFIENKISVFCSIKKTIDAEWEERCGELINEVLDQVTATKSSKLLDDILFSRVRKDMNDGIEQLRQSNTQALCGYVFKNGDLAFNCKQCQVDSTCVLCQKCFEESDHTGHEVTFHRTGTGGCCDCGDIEAWNPDGCCVRHGKSSDSQVQTTLEPEVEAQARFMIQHIYSAVTRTLDQVFHSFSSNKNAREELAFLKASNRKVPIGNVNILLNNDDFHVYQYVSKSLHKTAKWTGLDSERIRTIVDTVHHAGRAPVFTGSFTSVEELEELLHGPINAACSVLRDDRLLACISFDCQLTNERRAINGLKWLADLCIVSSHIMKIAVEGITSDTQFLVNVTSAQAFTQEWIVDRTAWPGREPLPSPLSLLRAILEFDCVIPKQLLMSFQALLLNMLVDSDLKQHLGTQYVLANSRVSSTFCSGLGTRRESTMQLSIHLLTVPSMIKNLEDAYQNNRFPVDVFVEFFDSLKYFFWSCCATEEIDGEKVYNSRLELVTSEALEQKRYIPVNSNAQYVFRMSKQSLVKDLRRLDALFGVAACLQRMDTHCRHQGREHVEHESSSWLTAFNLSLFLKYVHQSTSIKAGFDVAHACATRFRDSAGGKHNLFFQVCEMLFMRCFRWDTGEEVLIPDLHVVGTVKHSTVSGDCWVQTESGVVRRKSSELRYPVYTMAEPILGSKQPLKVVKSDVYRGSHVSHHIPVHRYFATFVVNFCLSFGAFSVSKALDWSWWLTTIANAVDMMQLIEDPLRIFVTNAQINAKMWTRNGTTMDCIVLNYKEVCSCFMYQSDLIMAQIALCVLGAKQFLTSLVHKFQLEYLVQGRAPSLQSSDFDNNVNSKHWTIKPGMRKNNSTSRPDMDSEDHNDVHVAEEMLRLLIHICTEIVVAQQPSNAWMRRVIIHTIASSSTPCTFSSIASAVQISYIRFVSIGGDTNLEHNTELDAPEDFEDETASVSNREIELILDTLTVKNDGNLASVTYSLKPEIWNEVDPLYRGVLKFRESRESHISSMIRQQNLAKKNEYWPMCAPAPGPVLPLLSDARAALCDESVVIGLIHPFLFRAVVASLGRIVGVSTEESFGSEFQQQCAKLTRPSLVHTVLHLTTLVIHQVKASGSVGAHMILMNRDCKYSVLELLVNLEFSFITENVVEEIPHVQWCNEELCGMDEEAKREIVEIRNKFGVEKKRKASKTKKTNSKKNRGGEAQRLAMERMKNAQANALKNFGMGDEDLEESTSSGGAQENHDTANESVCVLCHESLSKKPFGYLAYGRKSSWGYPIDILPGEPNPPTLLSAKRKPAGWSPAAEEEKARSGSMEGSAMDWGMSELAESHGSDSSDMSEDGDELDNLGALDLINEVFSYGVSFLGGGTTEKCDSKGSQNPRVVIRDTKSNVFVDFCPHAMHVVCYKRHIQALSRSRRVFVGINSMLPPPNIENLEFTCPMCKHFANMMIPSAPRVHFESSTRWPDSVAIVEREVNVRIPEQFGGLDCVEIADIIHTIDKKCRREVQTTPRGNVPLSQSLFSLWESISFCASAREAIDRRPGVVSDSSKLQHMVNAIVNLRSQWASYFGISAIATKTAMKANVEESESSENGSEDAPVSVTKIHNMLFGKDLTVSPVCSSSSRTPKVVPNPILQLLVDGSIDTPVPNCEFISQLCPEQHIWITCHATPSILNLTENTPLGVEVETTTTKDGQPMKLLPSDMIQVLSQVQNIITVSRKVVPAGCLLQMNDPVTYLVAALGAAPINAYMDIARVVALAALANAVLTRSSQSRRISPDSDQLALPLLPLCRHIDNRIDANGAYEAIYVSLLRFLRSSLIILTIATDAQIKPFQYRCAVDEVHTLWTEFLGMPPLHQIRSDATAMSLLDRWLAKARPSRDGTVFRESTRLGLIPLPENFENLLSQLSREAFCPTTGKLMRYPALCLRCGVVVCGNQQCCTRNKVGAGTLHAQSCGGGSGAFLSPERCIVVLVYREYAVDISAPYVDSHGETDDYLRRMRPLKFHAKAYENLGDICARNEICHHVVNIWMTNDHTRTTYPLNRF